ncbi:MAG: exopolysaccharide biosynthesis protein, partial [Bosea sp. (in: a-proteobacteria)]
MAAFGERAFGILMIIFCLPNMVPVPAVGALFGIPLLLIALQMAVGRAKPWLPRIIETKSIRHASLVKMVNAVEPRMRRIEGALKPRWTFLFSPTMDKVIGVLAVLCALSIIIPLPGSNFPPAIALILISLAVIQEDGLYLGFGAVIGIVGVTYTAVVIGGLAYAGWFALVRAFGL